jgi:perosamine synthetase
MAALAIKGGERMVIEAEITANLKWKAQYPILDEDREIRAVTDLMRSRKLSTAGREGAVAELEDALSEYYQTPYSLTFNCGTAALHSAYMAAGVGPGREVITSPYTWVTNVTAILAAGGIPVFADIDPHSYNIHVESIARRISPYTKAISVTHLYGHPADMRPIMELAKERNLIVIEDASQAHGARYRGQKVGTIGHIGCFSLQAGKQMIAGEGGFLLTADKELFERAMLFGQHPVRLQQSLTIDELKPYAASGLGFKYRIASISAAIARVQLERLDEWNDARLKNATRLAEKLAGIKGIRAPVISPDVVHTLYMFAMTYVAEELHGLERKDFIAALKAEGVPVMGNYCEPIHLHPLFQLRRYPGRRSPWEEAEVTCEVTYRKGDCPVAERRAEEELLIYFPRFTEYCPELMDAFATGIRKVVENVDELL